MKFIYISFIMVFTIASYNSNGLAADRMDYIGSLCSDFDFVLLQETWLLTENLSILHDRFSFMSCHGVSAMDSRQISVGRPHGVCPFYGSPICLVRLHRWKLIVVVYVQF